MNIQSLPESTSNQALSTALEIFDNESDWIDVKGRQKIRAGHIGRREAKNARLTESTSKQAVHNAKEITKSLANKKELMGERNAIFSILPKPAISRKIFRAVLIYFFFSGPII